MVKRACALILCFLFSLFALSSCGTKDADKENGTPGSSGAPAEDAAVSTTETKKKEKTYKVTFYSDDKPGGHSSKSDGNDDGRSDNNGDNEDTPDEIAKIDAVVKHESATPPTPKTAPGKIFVKWDSDFTDVTKDTVIHAVTEDVSDKPNVIAAQGTYGTQGQTVFVPLTLCGDVKLAGVDMTVTYDTQALEFDSVFDEDGALMVNADTPGEIRLNYISSGNTTADVDLCSLKFSVKAAEGEHALKTQINSIYAYNDAGELYTPEYTIMDANIYVYE